MGPRCGAVLLDADMGHGLAAGPARTSGKPGSGPSQWSEDTQKRQEAMNTQPWGAHDKAQAVILDGGSVLFTTLPDDDAHWAHTMPVRPRQQGTIWNYQEKVTGQSWVAKAQEAEARDVQDELFKVRQDKNRKAGLRAHFHVFVILRLSSQQSKC